MTEAELQLATVRMRLFDAAHADVLSHLESLTQLSRGTLVHALQLALQVEQDKCDPKAAAALTVFDLWLEWAELVKQDASRYENFVVWMRQRLEAEP